ncbi:hypothetical protein DFH06DRAFT_1140985 [Mycena polygramma]|nr:hypothetical protein DFH06DRAFT_1140985 [Mycena polygramma]
MDDYRYLTAADCHRLLEIREHPPCNGREDKDLMDYWLTYHRADRFRHDVFFHGILNFFDIKPSEVMGQIHCIKIPADYWGGPGHQTVDRHILFIQATTARGSGLIPAVRDSPIAIFDYHSGPSSAEDAPLWTRLKHTMNFRMERGAAAKLFSTLALTADNLLQPDLSQALVDWACYAAVGTEAATKALRPVTPRKRPQTPLPTRPMKPRRKSGGVDVDRTPRARRRLFDSL